MRPQRLNMEGFLAYRHRTEIDFTDADLFVLSGPTGSGKSSVIDGMTFALYGTIPRLDDRRSVAPVISAMSDQARVEFRFAVGDETYTAVRLVERTKTGATTTEARLQRGDQEQVLAGNADEVTAEVTRLLGLSYDHFTKAVVLPQGDFADFLTDKPKDRQALLRALLDLGLFEQVMQLANARAKSAEGKWEAIGERLAKLDVPTVEQLEEARRRLVAIEEANDELPMRLDNLKQVEEASGRAVAVYTDVRERLARLVSIKTPSDLATLEQDRRVAEENLTRAREELSRLIQSRKSLNEVLAGHPDPQRLESWKLDRVRLQDLKETRAGLNIESLGSDVVKTATARDEVRAALDRSRIEHAAHELRQGLAVGDPCPVCHTVISTIEPDDPDPALSSIDRLSAEILTLENSAAEARDRLKEAEGQSKQIEQRITEIEDRLSDTPDQDAIVVLLSSVSALIEQCAENDREQISAHEEMERANATLARFEEKVASLRRSLFAARDQVADEEPPIPGDDIVEGWKVFESWRLQAGARRKSELIELTEAVETAKLAASQTLAELESWLASLGVETTDSPQTDLALALERRHSEMQELEKTTNDAAELEVELALESTRARVASSLGTHLRANNFEAWLLEEAMEVLIDGANRLLDELSGGAYSLLARDSQFEVMDHRNARSTRTTKSLSGGETFLVALSLALSMAQQLAELTGISSRLESIFLDEGFGSLDQESLDIVASVLDELVGGGRTVGIVTHVRELADRIPFRFEVSKGPETASIVKVVA